MNPYVSKIKLMNHTSLKALKASYEDLYIHQHVPFSIERTRDKALMLMNNDFRTYSFIENSNNIPHLQRMRWSLRRLFGDASVEGEFKVLGWAPIENLFNYPKKYFTESQNIVNYRVEIAKNDKNNKKIDKSVKK